MTKKYIEEHKLLCPAKAAKELGNNKTALKELITVSDRKPVITPEGDKRKTISTVEMDFSKFS